MEQKQISLNQIYRILLELKLKMQKLDQYLEDLEFARQTAEAWTEIEAGRGITLTKEKFLKELENW